jgi:hypothetical protein
MTGLTLAEKASRSSRSQFCPSEPPPLWKQTALPLSSRPGEVMGLRPTQGDEKRLSFSNYSPLEARRSPLSSRPERTRISYFALLATSTCAALRTESRMQILNATGLHRKSGGAQWRELRFFPRLLTQLVWPRREALTTEPAPVPAEQRRTHRPQPKPQPHSSLHKCSYAK